MDVINAEQARIAEEAGAVAVMALERVPADIRKNGTYFHHQLYIVLDDIPLMCGFLFVVLQVELLACQIPK
jgi:hypothetical protein